MRRKIELLRDSLAGFIAQRADVLLVARCSDSDAAMTSKILESLDESTSSELFWIVLSEFRDATTFVEDCVQIFLAKHTVANLTLEAAKSPPLPNVPTSLIDPQAAPPIERLKQLIVFSRSLLPTLTGCAVVWSLMPTKIENPQIYAEFIDQLSRHELPFPWCHNVRMIVRDTYPEKTLASRTIATPRVRFVEVDFSPDAIRRSLEEDAGNDRLPLEDRVNCSLVLAGIDQSHARYDRAIQQYEIVHKYAAATGNTALAAIALNGAGESYRGAGNPDLAGELFQAAIAPASLAPGPPVPVLLNLYVNLGSLRFEQKRWAEAEVFYQGASEFALLLHDPGQRLSCWKFLGEAQNEQSKTEAALKTWTNGAIVAGILRRDQEHNEFRERLQQHYTRAADPNGWKGVSESIENEITTRSMAQSPTEIIPNADGGSPS